MNPVVQHLEKLVFGVVVLLAAIVVIGHLAGGSGLAKVKIGISQIGARKLKQFRNYDNKLTKADTISRWCHNDLSHGEGARNTL